MNFFNGYRKQQSSDRISKLECDRLSNSVKRYLCAQLQVLTKCMAEMVDQVAF